MERLVSNDAWTQGWIAGMKAAADAIRETADDVDPGPVARAYLEATATSLEKAIDRINEQIARKA
ncbi:hypothetical protein FF098_014950 [Parvularcula flava]|uniref:Uncharacterized protein n=1 Tax=Aquisalinus luteolus TaxID=1566827 RepID=A0A8J3A8K2_9PROT|nr:hypothetical protein [Aquisalinus luteolus]NHK29216.1 hypothetical protein [Aquisalinus luteolus]GGH99936.1 hypothetical protein GCM10011355_27050 [Aquisalinus luteolus]